MPISESNPAATLTFDAAVHRALARRAADTPWPHNGAPAPHAGAFAPKTDAAVADGEATPAGG